MRVGVCLAIDEVVGSSAYPLKDLVYKECKYTHNIAVAVVTTYSGLRAVRVQSSWRRRAWRRWQRSGLQKQGQ